MQKRFSLVCEEFKSYLDWSWVKCNIGFLVKMLLVYEIDGKRSQRCLNQI